MFFYIKIYQVSPRIPSIHLACFNYQALRSESISHIHCGYFRLANSNRLHAAELPISISTLWCLAKAGCLTWSPVSLGHLPLCNVIFAIVLPVHASSHHLLLHCHWELTVGPTSLSVPSIVLHARGHRYWWSFLR